MKTLVNKLKLAGLGLVMSLSLANCEPVEEVKPDYSQLKILLKQTPNAWAQKINARMYDAALDLTYYESSFYYLTKSEQWAYENTGREYTYEFRNMENNELFFKPEEGTAILEGEVSVNSGRFRDCYVGLRLEGSDPIIAKDWKLNHLNIIEPQ